MGVTIVMGRFLSAKKAKSHDEPTNIDFIKIKPGVLISTCDTNTIECSGIIPKFDSSTNGKNSMAPVADAKNKTGITAFLFSDNFFVIS
jgi:hypothetical protein